MAINVTPSYSPLSLTDLTSEKILTDPIRTQHMFYKYLKISGLETKISNIQNIYNVDRQMSTRTQNTIQPELNYPTYFVANVPVRREWKSIIVSSKSQMNTRSTWKQKHLLHIWWFVWCNMTLLQTLLSTANRMNYVKAQTDTRLHLSLELRWAAVPPLGAASAAWCRLAAWISS